MKTMAEYQKEWRSKDPQRNRDMQKKYFSKAKGKATVLFCDAKRRAKKRGLKLQITKDWIRRKLEAGVCEVTGIPFVLDASPRSPWSPSLDRINPERGYTYKNTRLVVWIHNTAKGTWTLDDVERYAEAFLTRARRK